MGERAKLRAAELSMETALTLLYTLDSFEFCVGGDGALDYTLRYTYLMNSREDTICRCVGLVAVSGTWECHMKEAYSFKCWWCLSTGMWWPNSMLGMTNTE